MATESFLGGKAPAFMRRPAKRVAFLVSEPAAVDHFVPVWDLLDKEKFDILLTGRASHLGLMDASAGSSNRAGLKWAQYSVSTVEDAIRRRAHYALVIEQHPVSGNSPRRPLSHVIFSIGLTAAASVFELLDAELAGKVRKLVPNNKVYPSLRLGPKRLRFMYGPDIGKSWSLAGWNSIYSYALCHGPNDARVLADEFGIECFQMGYPKYDAYFEAGFDGTNQTRAEFAFNSEKLTVLVVPTLNTCLLDRLHIERNVEGWRELNSRFNLVFRPHPFEFLSRVAEIQLLEEIGICVDRVENRRMVDFLGAADWIVSDSGGTPFGALYLEKNCILVPPADEMSHHNHSSNEKLAECFPVADASDVLMSVIDLIERGEEAKSLSDEVRNARMHFFGDLYGGSAQRAKLVIEQILEQ